MSDDYETTLTFRKTKYFWVQLNQMMRIKDRDALNNDGLYHLILFSSLPSDFNDLLDVYGCLDDDSRVIDTGYTDTLFHLGVEWLDNGENGFNLFVDEWDNEDEPIDVQIPIDDGVELLVGGVALAKETNMGDYIVAFAHTTIIKCQNYITLMKGSPLVGHQSCGVINDG